MRRLVALLLCHLVSTTTKPPSVFISVLVRNKAHTLPYFISCLESLNYPKNRIILHIRSDHNQVSQETCPSLTSYNFQDNSLEILRGWADRLGEEQTYHKIITDFGEHFFIVTFFNSVILS